MCFNYFKESVPSTTNILAKKETDKLLEHCDAEDEDISTALEKEIDELRTESKMPLSSRKFQVYLCYNYWLTLH
jgi:hypothetical protein